MSRNAPALVSTLPVAPGTAVVTPMYTSVGFNAGDYVYQYGANLVGWPKGTTMGLGAENTLIAGNTYTGYAQSGINSRAASYGPFTDTITYSGTTVTVGQILVSPATLSGAAYATGSCKCATLIDGRIAYAYRTGVNTLVTAIYSAAGVLQGTTTTVSTGVSFFPRAFSMCAMADGGFIVAYIDSGTSYPTYARLNSSNSVIYGPTSVISGVVVSLSVSATANYYAFGYHNGDGGGTGSYRIYTNSNSLASSSSLSVTGVYNTSIAGTSSDTFIFCITDGGNNQTIFYHLNPSGGQYGSTYVYGSATTSTGYTSVACGTTASTSATYAGAYSAYFAFPNASGSAVLLRIYTASTSTNITAAGSATGASAETIAIASINNGGCMLAYRNASGYLSYLTYGANGNQIASGNLVASAITNTSLGISGIAGGTVALAYAAPTTGYSTLATAYSAAYTNGVTTLTGTTSYTPANGYYVLGVALTTAAAGATGMVATNGSANLGSSYPSVTSNILFDYTGTAFTARSAINAQRGNVIGTNVTLRGLE